MSFPPLALQVILVLVAATAAFYDVRWRRIPNWLTLAGLILGLAINAFLFEWSGVRSSLLGLGLALLIYVPLYLLRGMGAGDVKLMAAIGSMVGPANWFGIFLITAILGGLAAIVLLASRRRIQQALSNTAQLVFQLLLLRPPYAHSEELDLTSPKSMKLPHGTVIAVGCAVFLGAAWLWAPR